MGLEMELIMTPVVQRVMEEKKMGCFFLPGGGAITGPRGVLL
ncbi:hypothetical protein ACVGXA_23125 [Enterobacter hormaechei]